MSDLTILKSKIALVAEDNEMICENLAKSLNFFCKEVIKARDGLEALELYREKEPDFIFTDVKMPNLDGLSLMKKIREKDKLTPIVVITAHSEIDLMQRVVEAEFKEYLIKPFDRFEFIDMLKIVAKKLENS